jgi:alanyl-tRNA synthetase
LIDQLRRKAGSAAVLLGSRGDDKVVLAAGITRDLQDKGLNAGEWIRAAAKAVGGSGGGRADMAQAGGKHPEKLPAALEAARADMQQAITKRQ